MAGGNPRIVEFSKKTRFTKENAREMNRRSHEAQRRKASAFASVRALIDETAPAEMLPAPVVDFWKKHGVERDSITPLMAEITPIYAAAIRDGDMGTLERVYRLLGVTFDSNREHNINLSVGNTDERAFEINYIVNGEKIEAEEVSPEE